MESKNREETGDVRRARIRASQGHDFKPIPRVTRKPNQRHIVKKPSSSYPAPKRKTKAKTKAKTKSKTKVVKRKANRKTKVTKRS